MKILKGYIFQRTLNTVESLNSMLFITYSISKEWPNHDWNTSVIQAVQPGITFKEEAIQIKQEI